MRAASAVSRAKNKQNAHEHTGQRRRSDIPRAMVLRLTPRSPWRPACLPPLSARCENIVADLTPASGRRDHTASPYASRALVLGAIGVHRIPPRVRDDRERPSCRGGTGRVIDRFAYSEKQKYFCGRGWTGGESRVRGASWLYSSRNSPIR